MVPNEVPEITKEHQVLHDMRAGVLGKMSGAIVSLEVDADHLRIPADRILLFCLLLELLETGVCRSSGPQHQGSQKRRH